MTKSCSPTIVITASGEVQTHEEATVYVKELDIFLTMKILENTPVVLSRGKLCDENGYSYEWINGQKPHLIKDGIRIICNTEVELGSGKHSEISHFPKDTNCNICLKTKITRSSCSRRAGTVCPERNILVT